MCWATSGQHCGSAPVVGPAPAVAGAARHQSEAGAAEHGLPAGGWAVPQRASYWSLGCHSLGGQGQYSGESGADWPGMEWNGVEWNGVGGSQRWTPSGFSVFRIPCGGKLRVLSTASTKMKEGRRVRSRTTISFPPTADPYRRD
jgi:hypothetical protein